MTGVRLQLLLARAGVASRRHAEQLITSGEVMVNGRVVTQLGTRVDPQRDRVMVRGVRVAAEQPAYVLLNKPKGCVCTAQDPDGRPTVFDLISRGRGASAPRLFSVGRLDYNTEGALLLTNDGELAHRLMHPSRGVEKVYHAKLRGRLSADVLERLREGVELPPAKDAEAGAQPRRAAPPARERSAPCRVSVIGLTDRHTWLEIALREGKNRQIHRMAEAVGSSLLKLTRVAYGCLDLKGLRAGQHRGLTEDEIAALRQLVGLGRQRRAPASPRPTRQPLGRGSPAPSRGARPTRKDGGRPEGRARRLR